MRNDNPITVATLTFLTFAAVILLVRFWPDLDGFQQYVCSDDCTVQGWLSALSGWIAAAVAAATVIPLWRQLQEARRQTSFIVGDDNPSLELPPSGWSESGKFRLVNWNRRPFYICELRWSAAVPIIELDAVYIDGKPYTELGPDGHLHRRLMVEGWENRSLPPPCLVAEYGFSVEDDANWDARQTGMATLEMIGYLSGEVRQKVTLHARAPIRETELDL